MATPSTCLSVFRVRVAAGRSSAASSRVAKSQCKPKRLPLLKGMVEGTVEGTVEDGATLDFRTFCDSRFQSQDLLMFSPSEGQSRPPGKINHCSISFKCEMRLAALPASHPLLQQLWLLLHRILELWPHHRCRCAPPEILRGFPPVSAKAAFSTAFESAASYLLAEPQKKATNYTHTQQQ